MKKLLLIVAAFISFSAFAQQYEEFYNVKFDVNKQLFPEYVKEDNMHMSSKAGAMVAAAYTTRPYSAVEDYIKELEMEVGVALENLSLDTADLNGKYIRGFTATANDENNIEKVFEVYLVEANKGNSIIIVVSGYNLSDKATYGSEGLKAALSAVIVQ